MLKLLRNLGKKEIILAIISLILIIAQVWLDLKMPDYMSEITVLVQTEGSEMSEIIKNGAYMLSCALGSLISAVIVGFLASNISANFSMTVRKKLFDKVGNVSSNGNAAYDKSTNYSNLGNNQDTK